jgi:hypothetical protein
VLTVNVPGVPDAAVPEHVGPSVTDGDTVQATVTVPLKPLDGVTVTVEVADPPGLTELGDSAVAAREKVGLAACEYFTT